MSGYLERLVSAAMRPSRAIHPIVGSLYAAPRTQAAAMPGREESAESAPRAGDHGATMLLRNGETAGPLVQPLVRRESEPAVSRNFLLERSARPLPGRWERAHHTTPESAGQKIGAERDVEFSPEAGKPGTPGKRQRLTGLERGTFQPEGADSMPLVPIRSAEAVQSGNAIGVSAGPPLPSRRAPVRVDATSEADEIQIHIGRIEVTAAPPADRAPAKPERKSINLGEYLQQRRGGNR
jgi:hypothetical protein